MATLVMAVEGVADDLAESSRRLRAELRDEQEVLEEASEQLARKEQTLADVVLEAMHRGRRLRVRIGRRSFTGTVLHVGQDVAVLRDSGGADVDIALGAVTELLLHQPEPGAGRARRRSVPATFADCLEGLEATGREVELGGADLDPVVCRVLVVATDHLVLARRPPSPERILALAAVGFIVRR